MKLFKSQLFRYILTTVVAFGLLSMYGCGKEVSFDIEGEKENIVFVNTHQWSPIFLPNGILFHVTKTPISTIILEGEKIEAKIVARCTKPGDKNIIVEFAYDQSLIDDNYLQIPPSLTLSMNKNFVTIPKGATISSDTLTVTLEGDLQLLETGNYLIPIKIISANNVRISERSTASLMLMVNFNNIQPNATSVAGTPLSRSQWSAILGSSDASNIFDNNNNTFSTGSSLPLELEVDMQSVQQKISGIRLQNQSRNYCMTSADIYLKKAASDEYQYQGRVSLQRPSNISTYPQFIQFIGAVDARYIKFNILSFYNIRYPIRLSEFIPYSE